VTLSKHTTMDNLTVGKILGAVAGNVASATAGIDASSEVAARCLGGRSLGQLFVSHSTFEAESRYQGMRKAFGDDTEIYRMVGSNPPELDYTDYDKLVNAALAAAKKSAAATAAAPAPPAALTTVAAAESGAEVPNPYLRAHANFPIIKWGWDVYPFPITELYTTIALGSTLTIAFMKWIFGTVGIPEVLYFVAFIMISGFTIIMLDVRREIRYILITENDVSRGALTTWQDVKADVRRTLPDKQADALHGLRHGHVYIHDDKLYIPVMAVRTVVEDDLASWLLLLNGLQGPLMSLGLFFLPDAHINWGVAYGIAAYFQARLQHAVAERYIKDAKTRRVFWFRKLQDHKYEASPRTFPLDSDGESISSMCLILMLMDFTCK